MSKTFESRGRPPHIRYFELMQISMIGIGVAAQLAIAREQILFNLINLGWMAAVLLGLTLAVSRWRKNWARWALLIIFVHFVVGAALVALLMPGVPLIAGLFAILLVAGLPGAVLSLAFTKQSSDWLHARNGKKTSEDLTGRAIEQQPGLVGEAMAWKSRLGDRPGLVWASTSGAGAGVGAWLACVAFPSARFAQNLIGHFSWALVGFASMVGLGFGLGQSATLAHLLKSAARLKQTRMRFVMLTWVIATAGSVFAMVFPLWWTDAEVLLLMPGYMTVVMAPGIALLAVTQWALIRWCAPLTGWLWRTAVGGAIGASMGLLAAMIIGAVFPLPMEAIWAGSFGLVIGAMQAKPIRELNSGTGASGKHRSARRIFMFPAEAASKPA